MIKYICVYVLSVFISSVSQVLLKISARKQKDNILQEYLNLWVITAYGILFCSSLLTIYAYKSVPLSMGPVIESIGYVFVTLLGYICLHETIGRKKALGLLCILVGISVTYI